jgi:hypothetical protein
VDRQHGAWLWSLGAAALIFSLACSVLGSIRLCALIMDPAAPSSAIPIVWLFAAAPFPLAALWACAFPARRPAVTIARALLGAAAIVAMATTVALSALIAYSFFRLMRIC